MCCLSSTSIDDNNQNNNKEESKNIQNNMIIGEITNHEIVKKVKVYHFKIIYYYAKKLNHLYAK